MGTWVFFLQHFSTYPLPVKAHSIWQKMSSPAFPTVWEPNRLLQNPGNRVSGKSKRESLKTQACRGFRTPGAVLELMIKREVAEQHQGPAPLCLEVRRCQSGLSRGNEVHFILLTFFHECCE